MDDIPNDIFAKLKCCECGTYITFPPLYTNYSFESVCGKCVESKQLSLVRNELFEETALLFFFPCKNAEFGCQARLKWGESVEHEKYCSIRTTVSCPSLPPGKCSWRGPFTSALQHFMMKHSKFVVSHPYIIERYEYWTMRNRRKFINVSHRNVLMPAHDFLFLLRFKVCFQNNVMWMGVISLGNYKLAPHFECFVEFIDSHEIYAIQVLHEVESFGHNSAVRIPLQSDIKITINRNSVKCVSCHWNFNAISLNQTYCCNNWKLMANKIVPFKRKLIQCRNLLRGCRYVDIPRNLIKHEYFFCKYAYSSCCFECKYMVKNERVSIIEHLISQHYDLKFKQNYIDISIIRAHLLDNMSALMETVKGNFFWHWGTTKVQTLQNEDESMQSKFKFHVDVFNDLPENEDVGFNLTVKFTNSITGAEVEKRLEKMKDITKACGWYTNIDIGSRDVTDDDCLVYSLLLRLE